MMPGKGAARKGSDMQTPFFHHQNPMPGRPALTAGNNGMGAALNKLLFCLMSLPASRLQVINPIRPWMQQARCLPPIAGTPECQQRMACAWLCLACQNSQSSSAGVHAATNACYALLKLTPASNMCSRYSHLFSAMAGRRCQRRACILAGDMPIAIAIWRML
jgi:hypothetical protein